MNYGRFINGVPCVVSSGVAIKLEDLVHEEFEYDIFKGLVNETVRNRDSKNIVLDDWLSDVFMECLND